MWNANCPREATASLYICKILDRLRRSVFVLCVGEGRARYDAVTPWQLLMDWHSLNRARALPTRVVDSAGISAVWTRSPFGNAKES